jgi:hypothetical protein
VPKRNGGAVRSLKITVRGLDRRFSAIRIAAAGFTDYS